VIISVNCEMMPDTAEARKSSLFPPVGTSDYAPSSSLVFKLDDASPSPLVPTAPSSSLDIV